MKAEEKKYTALITGGTRGIGRAVSIDLAKHFCHTLFINYLQNDAEAEVTKSMVEKLDCKVVMIKKNVAFPDEMDKMFDEIYANTESLDMFVHCPAINSFKPLINIKPNQWDITMNVNARSFLYCVQKCLPVMKNGKVVAVSSLGSRNYVPNYGSMGPTKSALESIVRYLAVELAGSGIRVNGVRAGFVQTDSITKFPDPEKMLEDVLKRTPAKRIGNVKDVSNVIMFLVSPLSDWIYGQNIIVDGGMSIY